MDPEETKQAHELANRLRLLLDAAAAENGTEPTYQEVATVLERKGVSLSRGRWSYMLNGHRYVDDPVLLDALSEFFDVDKSFLQGTGNSLPPRVTAQLDLVRSMRAAKVKSFAARTLGDVSPEALTAITRFLDEEVNKK